jgi:hypothetical protein
VWQLLQFTRDHDGLPLLPLVSVDNNDKPFKVPDAEGRIKLNSFMAALQGVADDELESVIQAAQGLQAEARDRYFRAALIAQVVVRSQRARPESATPAPQEAWEARARYYQTEDEVQAELAALDPYEYLALVEPVKAKLLADYDAAVFARWSTTTWQQTLHALLVRNLCHARLATKNQEGETKENDE